MSAEKTASTTDSAALERRIIEYAKVGVPAAVLLGTGIAAKLQGPAAAILVLAGGALVTVIAVFWSSLRTLLGETPLSGADAYALGAPRAEEEQKQAVLRALKDLEFERSVGKISDEDYQELVLKYRAEAKRLLRLLDADAQPRRKHVEALVATRLRRAGLKDGPAEADAGGGESTEAQPAEAADLACVACGTVNDADAVFCKKCGKKCAIAEPVIAKSADSLDESDGEDDDGQADAEDDDEANDSKADDDDEGDETDDETDDDDEAKVEAARPRGRRGRR